VSSGLTEKRKFRTFLSQLFEKECVAIKHIDYIFCSDNYLLGLNDKFLHHDYYTDTITFELSPNPLIAESYISVERIRENSQKLMEDYQEELKRVIIHSSLHMCGYDDVSKAKKDAMFRKQETYLNKWKSST